MTNVLWDPLRIDKSRFDQAAMMRLLSGQYSFIAIDNFLSEAECSALVKAIQRRGLRKTFRGSTVESTMVGQSAIEFRNLSEADYRADVHLSTAEKTALLDGLEDPNEKAMRSIGAAWGHGAHLAPDYFSGTIRLLSKSTTHNDWTPRDLPNWTIGRISRSLSWHIYLSEPETGGEFRVWNRHWNDGDSQYLLPNPADGYTETFLQDVPVGIERCRTGRFVIFDTRNYHAFRDTSGVKPCYVTSSFLGVVSEGEPLIFWS